MRMATRGTATWGTATWGTATPDGRSMPATLAGSALFSRRFCAGALVAVLLAVTGCRETTDPQDTCDTVLDLTVGVPVEGVLSSGDCRLDADNTFADYWQFVLTGSTALQIDLTSSDFDAFLILRDATSGAVLTYTDIGGSDDNARLVITLSAGTYWVLANSLLGGETGAYELIVAVNP